jgi:ribosome-binding protein aMBF1 (putative translation factor)
LPLQHDVRPNHLQPAAELAERVLLPGDPARALAVAQALLDAASPEGALIQVSFRIFPEAVEVDVLRSPANAADLPAVQRAIQPPETVAATTGGDSQPATATEDSFASWMAAVLKREGLSQEAAARQLGVSVKTVSRWVGGETEPRLRELRRIHEVFGEAPIG